MTPAAPCPAGGKRNPKGMEQVPSSAAKVPVPHTGEPGSDSSFLSADTDPGGQRGQLELLGSLCHHLPGRLIPFPFLGCDPAQPTPLWPPGGVLSVSATHINRNALEEKKKSLEVSRPGRWTWQDVPWPASCLPPQQVATEGCILSGAYAQLGRRARDVYQGLNDLLRAPAGLPPAPCASSHIPVTWPLCITSTWLQGKLGR